MATALPAAADAFSVNSVRALKLYNVNNRETIYVPYWKNGRLHQAGLNQLDHFFRDWRSGDVKRIDRGVYDILYSVQEGLGAQSSGLHLISGYRSPATNNMLRRRSGGVAKSSLHLTGKASDIRIPSISTRRVHKAAKALGAGGVGYYGESDFVHVDTGRVRYW